MQKSVHLCLVAMFTLTELTFIVGSLVDKSCTPGRENFSYSADKYRSNEPVYEGTGVVFCNNQKCNEITTCEISSVYGALFDEPPKYMSKASCQEQPSDDTASADNDASTGDNGGSKDKNGASTGDNDASTGDNKAIEKRDADNCGQKDDGDLCCETKIYPTKYVGWHENTNGDGVYVLCIPGSGSLCGQFQFVSQGRCKSGSKCAHTGKPCTQEYTVHTLLAYKPGASFPYMSFEKIKVPAYCSCKNLNGRR